MSNLNPIVSLAFLALLIEGAIEYFVAEPLKKNNLPTWPIRYVALALSIAAAFGFEANLPAIAGLAAPDWVCFITTGLAISRGANYLSDLVGNFHHTQSRQ